MRTFEKHLVAICGISAMFAASTASAQIHAQMHTCRVAGGQFAQAMIKNREVGLCRIGSSVVGSMDLVGFIAVQSGIAISIESYRRGIKDCTVADGQVIKISNLENRQSLEICRFKDGSLMDLPTLQAGKESSTNARFNRVLDIR